jgi:hypothetical protein
VNVPPLVFPELTYQSTKISLVKFVGSISCYDIETRAYIGHLGQCDTGKIISNCVASLNNI